jgi:hypothetical protein
MLLVTLQYIHIWISYYRIQENIPYCNVVIYIKMM